MDGVVVVVVCGYGYDIGGYCCCCVIVVIVGCVCGILGVVGVVEG